MNNRFYVNLNIEDYFEDNWGNKSKKEKLQVLKHTASLLRDMFGQKGIMLNYSDQMIYLNHISKFDLRVKVDVMEQNEIEMAGNTVLAEHDPKTGRISIAQITLEDGSSSFAALCHEFTHEIQRALVKHIDKYPKNSLEYEYLTLLKSEIDTNKVFEMNAFNENLKLKGYIYLPESANLEWHEFIDVAKAFNAIQVSERSTYAIQYGAYDYITSVENGEDQKHEFLSYVKLQQQKYVDEVNSRYKTNLSYDEICKAIDSSKLKLITGRSPEKGNDLEAAIMYDLITIFKIQTMLNEKSWSKQQELRDDCMRFASSKYRKKILHYAYEGEGKNFVSICDDGLRIGNFAYFNDYEEKGGLSNVFFDLNNLKNMDDEELQIGNPRLIASAIFTGKKESLKYIKNFEAFKDWYFSQHNNLTDLDKDLIAESLGDAQKILVIDGELTKEFSAKGQAFVVAQTEIEKNVFTIPVAQKIIKNVDSEYKFYDKKRTVWRPSKNEKKTKKVSQGMDR